MKNSHSDNMIHASLDANNPKDKTGFVGEWGGLPDTTSPPTGFIPNSYLDTTGNKTYFNRNSAKQVPQVEGLPEQRQTTMTPSHVVKVIAQ